MSSSFVFKNSSLLEFTIPLLVSSPSLLRLISLLLGYIFFTFVLLGSRIPLPVLQILQLSLTYIHLLAFLLMKL
jgi:hypothetical protein